MRSPADLQQSPKAGKGFSEVRNDVVSVDQTIAFVETLFSARPIPHYLRYLYLYFHLPQSTVIWITCYKILFIIVK